MSSSKGARLFARIVGLYEQFVARTGEPLEQLPRSLPDLEFEAVIAEQLGDDFDAEKRATLLKLQHLLNDTQRDAAERLQSGQLSREQYLAELNRVTEHVLKMSRNVLGPKDFERLFGTDRTDVQLVDPETFHRADGRAS